jgi:hypothetical protein
MKTRKMPIGIQDFEDIRSGGCALVKIGAVFDQETRTISEWETA